MEKAIGVSQKEAVLELRDPVVYASNGTVKDIQHINGAVVDTCFIKFICNSTWTVSTVRNKTNASVTVLQPSGKDDAVVQVVFNKNTKTSARIARVKIDAEGCESKLIDFSQDPEKTEEAQ